jgi:hypothetical protein
MSQRLLYLIVAVLSLLQTVQPLLHAHVGGVVHEPRLVHFHSLRVAADESLLKQVDFPTQSLQYAAACDPPSITVSESFRRHTMLVWTPTPDVPVSAFVPPRGAGTAPLAPSVGDTPRALASRLLPPALAPPSYS